MKIEIDKPREEKTTQISWSAWYVYYEPPCEGRENIGFYQTEMDAEAAKNAFIETNNLKSNGICCTNTKYIYKDKIIIY